MLEDTNSGSYSLRFPIQTRLDTSHLACPGAPPPGRALPGFCSAGLEIKQSPQVSGPMSERCYARSVPIHVQACNESQYATLSVISRALLSALDHPSVRPP